MFFSKIIKVIINDNITNMFSNNKYWPDIEFNVEFAGHKDKVKYLTEIGCDIFIEDRFKNANVISDKIKKVYLVNRPWNQGRKENSNVERVNSFKEAVEKIIKSRGE